MGQKAATATSSAPNFVTVEALVPLPYACYDVTVTAVADPPGSPNAVVTVNGAPVAANVNEVVLLDNLRLRAISAGSASVTVGPSPESGTNLTVLGWAKSLLRLQLWLGAGLIVIGGALAVIGSQQTQSVTTLTAGTSPTSTTVSNSVAPSTPPASASPTTPSLPSGSGATGATAGSSPTTSAGPITQVKSSGGGTTSSDTSLLQSVALALIASGATLIPTGAASILTGKINTPPS